MEAKDLVKLLSEGGVELSLKEIIIEGEDYDYYADKSIPFNDYEYYLSVDGFNAHGQIDISKEEFEDLKTLGLEIETEAVEDKE